MTRPRPVGAAVPAGQAAEGAPPLPGTVRAVPDLDDELTTQLREVEELLLTLAGWQDDGAELPPGLAGRAALDAVRRVSDAIRPTQGLAGPRMLAPDGRYEHMPIRFVEVDQGDVDVLSAAAAALGRGWRRGSEAVTEALAAHATGGPSVAGPASAEDLAERVARVAGLLDLEWTEDLEVLQARCRAGDGQRDVVLTGTEEASYQRTADRLNGMWALGGGLSRFLY